ncbi:alanine racemase C-terminal domain-containing protein, partial [Acinetobacter baumannii]
YYRGFSNAGGAKAGDVPLPVIGRVSMDLTAVDVSRMPDMAPGDWLTFDFNLPRAAAASGMSQYELLTGLGHIVTS